ncbi:Fic family protein [Raoultibacter phocaeensis]|uniref:Fic family protein n=1 Tax=Raoultibacter phocaeensis TaxID=2479841 RepID=UPI001119501F|nr:hypothetical protein [Raoultibacter phocaeensis]
MRSELRADDGSLLECAFSLATQSAQTLGSLAAALEVSVEETSLYWLMVNKLRKRQGHVLPVPIDSVAFEGISDAHQHSKNWYAPTWRLQKLLEEFQINEGLAVHYETILTEPEGGHYELNLAASEVVLAVQLENDSIDVAQMMRVCVHACEPMSGLELLVSNAGKILIDIETHRSEPLTASFIEDLYAKLTEGIAIKEVREPEAREKAVGAVRYKALESFCECVWPCEAESSALFGDVARLGRNGCGNHTLVNALIALYYFKTFRPFPAGNNVLAYLLYVIILHRAGYHFSAHVPVMKVLYSSEKRDGKRCGLGCDPQELAIECDGYSDWSLFFERAVEGVIGEQRWTMTKLEGMSKRRERFRTIIDTDETMNFRQKEVLLEAILHSNAEFTYAIHEQRYDVSYPCARSDFSRLLDLGFLKQHDDGIRHFFFASDVFADAFLAYLKEHCPEAFYRYYQEDGSLRKEFRSAEDAATEYNKGVGFYEKSLLDKTYVEHYDFRRTPIADCDGPHRRSRPKG